MSESAGTFGGSGVPHADELLPPWMHVDRLGVLTGAAVPACGSTDRPFGGALAAHALVVASWARHSGSEPHSLGTHFLGRGVAMEEVVYTGEIVRRTRSFSTVQVQARQGRHLLSLTVASFHTPKTTASHEADHASFDDDPSIRSVASGGPIPPVESQARLPFDLRRGVNRTDEDGRPRLGYWLRAKQLEVLGPIAQAASLAWVSDLVMTRVADLEHEGTERGVRVAASLEHRLWFHRRPNLADWGHLETTSPVYRQGLALSTGQFRNRRGEIVATLTQESLLARRNQP